MTTSSELRNVWRDSAPWVLGIAPVAVVMLLGIFVPTAPQRKSLCYPVSRVLQWVDRPFVAAFGFVGPLGTELVNGALHGFFVGGVLWLWCPPWVCAVAGGMVTLCWGVEHGCDRILERAFRILAEANRMDESKPEKKSTCPSLRRSDFSDS